MEIKLVVSDPKTGKAYQKVLKGDACLRLRGKRIGEELEGSLVGLPGYRLRITGGTDSSGFPMKPGVRSMKRHKLLLSGGVGFRPKRRGERRRKTVRGDIVAEDIAQLNLKVVGWGKKSVEELLGSEAA